MKLNIGDKIKFNGDTNESTLIEIYSNKNGVPIYYFSNPSFQDSFSLSENEIQYNTKQDP